MRSRATLKLNTATGTTRTKLSNVKVKRKGQVTIPAGLREKLKIQEGSLLQVEQRDEGILLKPLSSLGAGEVVGEETYRKILRDLENLRKKWR
jgi:AbrB family looped-hinge helix DNA binding protein